MSVAIVEAGILGGCSSNSGSSSSGGGEDSAFVTGEVIRVFNSDNIFKKVFGGLF